MSIIRIGVSLRHICLFVYLCVLLLVLALLAKEVLGEKSAFSLSRVAPGNGLETNALAVYGDNFHSDIKGVLAKTLVNEDAVLWHHYTDVPFRLLDVSENLALSSYERNKIVSISLAEDDSPVLLGSIEVPGTIGQIKIVGDKALVGMTRGAGVGVVDLSDPEQLKLIEHYPLPGTVNSVAEARDVVYLSGVDLGVARLDLAAESPKLEVLSNHDSAWRIDVHGDRVAVGTLDGQVSLFDIDPSGKMLEVGTFDFQSQVRGVAFTDKSLVVTFADKSLSSFSLSAWPNMPQPQSLHLPGSPMELKRVPGQEKLVVAMISNGWGLVDVSQTEAPVFSGWMKLPKTFRDFNVGSDTILATSDVGLALFSLQEIEAGVLSRRAPEAVISQTAYKLETRNLHVYGQDRQGQIELVAESRSKSPYSDRYLPFADARGVRIFEQHENGQLLSIGSVAMAEGAVDARFRGGYLFAVYHKGLRIFSAENIEELMVVGDLPISGKVKSFEFIDSETLIVSTQSNGVLILDVKDPKKPKQVTRLSLPIHLEDSIVRDLLIHGQRAYLSQGPGGVYVIDISSPLQPELLQVVDTPGYAGVMALHDDLLYVADGVAGLFVIDVESSKRALPVGSLQVPVRIAQIAVADDGLIISGRNRLGGTMKLPLPKRFQEVRLVSEGELAVDVDAIEQGQYIYLYDNRSSAYAALDVH